MSIKTTASSTPFVNEEETFIRLTDSSNQTPHPTEISEPNDAIKFAVDTQLSDYPNFSVTSSIDYEDANSYENEDGTFKLIDATEDVDLYKVDLKAGDTIKVDIDSRQLAIAGQLATGIDAQLRVFNAAGTELAFSDDVPAPDEIFLSEVDPYLEFTAPADGAYYVGVSIFDNSNYNPSVPGSGSGSTSFTPFTSLPLTTGEYVLNIDLNSDAKPAATVIPCSTGEGATVSLQSFAATYNVDFLTGNYSIIAPAAVENPEPGQSALVLALQVDGEIPEGGLEVFVNSDSDLTELFASNIADGNNLAYPLFSRGGQVLTPIFDQTGKATGFKFRVDQSNAVVSLPIRNDGVTNEPKHVNFSVEPAAGYVVSDASTAITIYDTLDQVPTPTVTPEVSVTASNKALIEAEGDSVTFNFSLSEAPPSEGVLTLFQVNNASNPVAAFNAIGDFDLDQTKVTGGVFPIDNPASSGFYFKITEQTASIALPALSDETVEGVEEVTFALEPSAGYTVNPNASSATLTIADTPESQIQVSLATEPTTLVESEATVSVHTFTLSATPPEAGVTVFVEAANLSDFNLDDINVTGGSITQVTDAGFFFNIIAQGAGIELPVAADEDAEGLEEATFTLEAGVGYQVDPVSNSGTFAIADTPDQLPLTETEANDTIPTALATGLSAERSTVSISAEIAAHGEGSEAVDASEDVDFYAINLQAGNTVTIDVDSSEYQITGLDVPQRLDSVLRLFNADGDELLTADNAAAPDEGDSANRDAYLTFTAEAAGTYYAGVGQSGNTAYDPFTLGSGSGIINPTAGINTGAYSLEIYLTLGSSSATL